MKNKQIILSKYGHKMKTINNPTSLHPHNYPGTFGIHLLYHTHSFQTRQIMTIPYPQMCTSAKMPSF